MSNQKRKKGGARLEKHPCAEQENKTAPAGRNAAKAAPQAGKKKARRKRTPIEKLQRALMIALIALAALSALFLIAYGVYRSWAKKPDLSNADKPTVSQAAGPAVSPDAPQTSDGAGSTPYFALGGDRKEDFYTFLVIGRDTGGGGNTDTILLAAYDIPNQQLSVMSIPRDTMVNIPYDIKRINAVYNDYGGGDDGIDALYTEVSQLVGFIPDFSIVVEWKAVGELVDAMGGVYFEVPRNMNYDDPTQNLHIHVNKGYQLLDGDKAMGVVRWRQNNDGSGYVTGDIGRIETQQAFLKAVVSQCLQIKNAAKIQEFAQVFTDNVTTDLTLGNLAWFAEQAIFGGLTSENVNFMTLPGNYNATAWSRTYKSYQSYVTPDGDALLEMVNQYFNPYLEDRTSATQDIMSVNRDGSLSSSTGHVEDTRAASAPARSSSSSSPSSSPSPSPSPSPSAQPSDGPDAEVSPDGSAQPGAQPSPDASPSPSAQPSPAGSDAPFVEPSDGGEPDASPSPSREPDTGEERGTDDPALALDPDEIPSTAPAAPTPTPAPAPEEDASGIADAAA